MGLDHIGSFLSRRRSSLLTVVVFVSDLEVPEVVWSI